MAMAVSDFLDSEYLVEPASQFREQRPRPRLPDLATQFRRLASDLTLDRIQRGDASDGLDDPFGGDGREYEGLTERFVGEVLRRHAPAR